ncbi:MAG: ribosomal protein S12 methylthiotransferase RimO [Deltaproteobacteria bacterium RBG_13_49_15]|nr:MAG: ribosomal protein S12 methylthiotransferase RimO [Deltaproteobacteria bacterium RBG_13_49_15]
MKLHLVSLGCPKNLVDSEVMLGRLMESGIIITQNPKEAQVIVINTCSFIEPAVNESIDTILELSKHKKSGRCRRLIVTGCLPQRYQENLSVTLPEVDAFLGTGAYDQIVSAANGLLNTAACVMTDPNSRPPIGKDEHRVRSSQHLAYVKIAEGCSRHCTYCIIPALRGKQKSRHAKDILSEIRFLVASGVKEVILVAQETSSYGYDISGAINLNILLRRISRVEGSFRIRLLYGHPKSITEPLIQTVAKSHNICPYFDIPVQHASDGILKRMGREYTQEQLYQLFDTIRSIAPDAALRTTFLVGFPGETEQDFDALCAFAEDVRFDHAGVFIYSDAADIPSHNLQGSVTEKEAMERRDHLMSLQASISLEKNRSHKGKIFPILIEEKIGKNRYTGRTGFQAPQIDGITRVKGNRLNIGSFVPVKITNASEYDLTGDAI